jgi:type III pantothenate kinase
MTFLALDVGNTRLKWAVYEAPQPGARLLAQGAVFLENIEKLAEEEWQGLSRPAHSGLHRGGRPNQAPGD